MRTGIVWYLLFFVQPSLSAISMDASSSTTSPEATPYLQNVIISSNPFVRPNDYGIPLNAEHWDERTVRNIKLPWAEAKKTTNFLWKDGYQFYCLTPKSRHSVHSSWANVDWHLIWNSNFGDPYRLDKRLPNVSEH